MSCPINCPKSRLIRLLVPAVMAVLALGQSAAVTQNDLPGPVVFQIGYVSTPQPTREAAGSSTYSVGAGYRPWRQGLVGALGFDGEFLSSHGQHGAIDRLGFLYTERVTLDHRIYVGGGLGIWALQQDDQVASETRFAVRPGVRLLTGYSFNELPNRRIRPALEASVTYAGSAAELDLTTVGVALVIGF